ncbi:MAG: hypothetical protein Q9166_005720 [cf. Caloplaca sp. 2 TL-2023]
MALNRYKTSEQMRLDIEEGDEEFARRNQKEAFPRVCETETPELDLISSESESDRIPVSLSKRGGQMSKSRLRRARRENQRNSSAQQPAVPSLRPAQDIMNRIRHDPSLQISDYVVGYEDRHAGLMWKGVEEWLDTTEEEDFIPMHRIRCFKRRSDGYVVWDREKRIDEIFGSGVSGGAEGSDET